MSATLFPKKTFKDALDTYYTAMATYQQQGVTNEEATRLAFRKRGRKPQELEQWDRSPFLAFAASVV